MDCIRSKLACLHAVASTPGPAPNIPQKTFTIHVFPRPRAQIPSMCTPLGGLRRSLDGSTSASRRRTTGHSLSVDGLDLSYLNIYDDVAAATTAACTSGQQQQVRSVRVWGWGMALCGQGNGGDGVGGWGSADHWCTSKVCKPAGSILEPLLGQWVMHKASTCGHTLASNHKT